MPKIFYDIKQHDEIGRRIGMTCLCTNCIRDGEHTHRLGATPGAVNFATLQNIVTIRESLHAECQIF